MFRVEKRVERKSDKLYVKWKSYNNSFNSRIDKKKSLYKMSYFPELYTHCKNKKKFELDLSNYIKKILLNNATGIDTSNFAKKSDLASLKSEIDEFDIGN